jgi:hypothetical protein
LAAGDRFPAPALQAALAKTVKAKTKRDGVFVALLTHKD